MISSPPPLLLFINYVCMYVCMCPYFVLPGSHNANVRCTTPRPGCGADRVLLCQWHHGAAHVEISALLARLYHAESTYYSILDGAANLRLLFLLRSTRQNVVATYIATQHTYFLFEVRHGAKLGWDPVRSIPNRLISRV